MNSYLVIKTLHILASVLVVGTGFGSAFYLFFANRSKSLPSIAVVSRLVVRADLWFTAPAVIFQPLSGWWLASAAGWSLDTPWIVAAFVLYAIAGLCWLPVVWLQYQLAALSRIAVAGGTALPDQYWRYAQLWQRLGYPAFAAMLCAYFLMVVKPPLY